MIAASALDQTIATEAETASALPVRSARTSLVLAELARQRRHERVQRRKGRARCRRWLAALFDPTAFQTVRVHEAPSIIFAVSPLVYSVGLGR